MSLNIFVSSTVRYLGNAREYIRQAIEDMGHTPTMNEYDEIGYKTHSSFEVSCYQKIKGVQIVVSIIDDYFGTESELDNLYSISNMELLEAIKLKKQIYVFVSNKIYAKYDAWSMAKAGGTKFTPDLVKRLYGGVDERTLKFIQHVTTENKYIYISRYDNTRDIITSFKKQLSNLFEVFLIEQEEALLGSGSHS